MSMQFWGEIRPVAKFSIDNLAPVELLEGLKDSDLQDLEQHGRWRRYVAEEQILDRDSETRDVFFVIEGSVDVINFSLSGREVAYGQVRAGGYFGEMAAIDGRRRSANIVANQDSLVFILPAEAFMEILNTHASAAMVALRRLAHIVRTADDRIMDLSTLRAVQRVHVEVLRLASEVEPGEWMIKSMPTQRDIARRASTSRETVARVMSQLAKVGIVERKGRTLHVLDQERLGALTEAGDEDLIR